MKIKSLGILTALSIMALVANANAGLYVGGTYGMGGYTLFAEDEDISKSVQSYGGILGFDISLFRIEGEYSYLDSDDYSMNTGFLNAYVKVPIPVVKPYIGAGVGYMFDSKYEPAKDLSVDIDDTMAYQGMLGITLDLPIIPFDIDVEGRALYVPDMIEVAGKESDYVQYEGRVKLRYVF